MTNILVITHLYPGYPDQSRTDVTYAIHYFAVEWMRMGYRVRVVRPWIALKGPHQWLASRLGPASRRRRARAAMYDLPDGDFLQDEVPVTRLLFQKAASSPLKYDIPVTSCLSRLASDGWKPDVVVGHTLAPDCILAYRIAKAFRVPLVVTLHHSDTRYSRRRKVLMRLHHRSSIRRFRPALDYAAAICFRNPFIRTTFESRMASWLCGNKIKSGTIVHSGTDFPVQPAVAERDLSRPIRIITVSSLKPGKNIDTVLHALQRCSFDWRYTIVGEGPDLTRLRGLVRHLRLCDRVEFAGYRERGELPSLLRACDVFVMVSAPETFGLAYLEAMSQGTIPIASVGQGMDGVVVDGFNGYLCKPRSVSGLWRVLRTVVTLPGDTVRILRKNAIATALRMSQAAMSHDYIHWIEQLSLRDG